MRKRSQLGLAALIALCAGLHAGISVSAAQNYVSSFDWSEGDPHFGGLSAIELSDDGTSFIALSDSSILYTGQLSRAADGQIDGVDGLVAHPVLGALGSPLDRAQDDSEGLAVAADGSVFISQEGPARVLMLGAVDSAAQVLPVAPDFRSMQTNSALEALAIDANGALYTMPERSGQLDRPFPVYRFANGAWSKPFSLPRSGDYLMTAADFGPDGRLYVLERSFQGIAGFQSRVRRFVVAGDNIDAGEVVLETELGEHGNLEGLSVWRDGAGALRLTMVSDDNFRFFLRTTLVEYSIAD